MLSESQIASVWERQISAEVRSLYFGELASKYAKKKQAITFLVFFLSSGAAGTLIAKLPSVVPITLSLIVALLSAYTIAVNLDVTIRTMAKFHYSWSELALGYEALWANIHGPDADLTFESLARRERDLSELATTDAPNDQGRLGYWQDQVFKQHHLISPHELNKA
jgi:hypothetical protein